MVVTLMLFLFSVILSGILPLSFIILCFTALSGDDWRRDCLGFTRINLIILLILFIHWKANISI